MRIPSLHVHSLVAHAARPDGPAWNESRRASWAQKAEDDLDRLRRIWREVEEAGFSADVEPLSPPAALVVEGTRGDRPPLELVAELRELARGGSC